MSKNKLDNLIEKIKREQEFVGYHISGLDVDENESCFVSFGEYIVEIYSIEQGMKLVEQIEVEKIKSIEVYNDKEEILAPSNKSTVGRTFVGYLLGGTTGAFIGGMSSLIPEVEKNDICIIEIKTKGKKVVMQANY